MPGHIDIPAASSEVVHLTENPELFKRSFTARMSRERKFHACQDKLGLTYPSFDGFISMAEECLGKLIGNLIRDICCPSKKNKCPCYRHILVYPRVISTGNFVRTISFGYLFIQYCMTSSGKGKATASFLV